MPFDDHAFTSIMVREMYRHTTLAKWKVVFVTDRTQLEALLGETSLSVGYTVKVADSIKKLKELLASTASDLVMAMIHKFQESDLETTFPELNASAHILVMTDEAHRTQYSLLGANLDKAIPNATKIGYTGTPIDKTERVFGDYIDKYTMRQSIENGVTLEIVYEGRTHKADTPDPSGMDQTFADVFQDYTPQQCLEILGYGSRDAYLEAEPTIAAKARDMVGHYLRHVFPNGYKAQIVATSREAAVRYKAQVDEAIREEIARLKRDNPFQLDLDVLRTLQSDVIISGKHNDEMHLLPFTNASTHETTIKSFKLPFGKEDQGVRGDVGIVIVNNMLLTGFDAPVEQVLYLDKILLPRVRKHALELGVEFASAKIVDSRFRWGSCTPRNNVNFNWRLIKAPMFVIDYVIAHELAHLLEPNHTPRFWGLLRAHTTKMESAKAWLLENGQELDDGWG